MKCEKGYGFISIKKIDNKHKVVQIKKEFAQEFYNLFVTESEEHDIERIQEELNSIRDFAFSFLVDMLETKNHKISYLTKEELENKHFS